MKALKWQYIILHVAIMSTMSTRRQQAPNIKSMKNLDIPLFRFTLIFYYYLHFHQKVIVQMNTNIRRFRRDVEWSHVNVYLPFGKTSEMWWHKTQRIPLESMTGAASNSYRELFRSQPVETVIIQSTLYLHCVDITLYPNSVTNQLHNVSRWFGISS